MGDGCSKFVICLVAFFLLAGLGGLACGGIGNHWFTTSRLDTNVGLWKHCKLPNKTQENSSVSEKECTTRENIFVFEDKDEIFEDVKSSAFDWVLLLLVIAGGTGFLAMISSLTMCCVSYQGWRKLGTALILFTFVAAGSGVTAIVLSEIWIKRKMPESQINLYEHGWSAILAWVGAGSLVLSFVFATITCCTVPANKYESSRSSAYDEFSYTPNHNRSLATDDTQRRASENAGYENQ